MFYYLSLLRYEFFALNIFKYITFRAGMAAVTTFLICVIFGPWFIRKLQEWNLGDKQDMTSARGTVLTEELKTKHNIPAMGGILIIGSILLSVFLWSDLSNPYVILTVLTMIWLAVLGFYDDYLKLSGKSKSGLNSSTKMIWQVILAGLVSLYVYTQLHVSTSLDVPFLKNLVVDLGAFYILFAMVVVVGASNAVNLTDGLDGLAIGCTLMVAITLGILCYISGNSRISEYLFIPYLPGTGELTIFCAAMIGASLGFLWFNAYPATVFMGDVGSLALGGTLGIIAVFIKKELLLGILGGVFVWEALSVILQVASFKLTGKRIFKCAPYHHHLQKLNWKESKIVIRFWIVGIILALVTLTTLKIR